MFSFLDILNEDEDLLREADGDEEAAPAGGGGDDDDEDFNIDTSLDVDTGDDDTGDDNGDGAVDDTGNATGDEGGEESYETSDSGSSGGGGGIDTTSDTEPVKRNTDLFQQLSAEEQAIKIGELKKLYKDLYMSVDDIARRLDDIDIDEYSLEAISRINLALHRMKQLLSDYLDKTFDRVSYYENDFKFNEYLLSLQTISEIIDELARKKEQRTKKDKKDEKEREDFRTFL